MNAQTLTIGVRGSMRPAATAALPATPRDQE